MQPFEYASPKTLKEALALLGTGWGDAAVLAGGTDLLSLMKDNVMAPKRVVNVKEIPELKGITKTGAGVRIGAAVTVDELANNALIRASFPALLEAAQGISSMQMRNMGTVGGDLCQRPRCWYFRAGFGLLPTHEGKNLVAEGDSRYHAILGAGPAHFVSASSFGPALIALGAKVKIASAKGTREVEAAKFFVAPQNNETREVALQPNEILTEIVVPVSAAKNATYEIRQKDALDWPLATASVSLTMKGTAVGSARIVLGHVGPTPFDADGAAKWLAGKSITVETAEAAGKAAVESAKPLKDNAYKVQMAAVAVKRALLAAAGVKA
ncbi:MAG TPA: xanthine dehydrogenase family protein subunit M [Paludibaculum sp.]|jgi:xanthine dehydrogenase YagS FAD-binding subunit